MGMKADTQFESILSYKKISEEALRDASMPNCFFDLNMNQVMDEIKLIRKEYNVEKLYYLVPHNQEEMMYRQGAMKDVEDETLFQELLTFSKELREAREFQKHSEEAKLVLQKECWFLDASFYYNRAILRLTECLENKEHKGEAFSRLHQWLKEYITTSDFQTKWERTKELMQKLSSVRFTIRVQYNRVFLEETISERAWMAETDQLIGRSSAEVREEMENPFGSIFSLSSLEISLVELLEKKHSDYFTEIHKFYQEFHEVFHPVMLRFEKEVQLYISYCLYMKKLIRGGFSFCYAEITEQDFDAKGCYDIVLARKNMISGEAVICNEIHYRKQEQFFVVTGPNQGGKTTFARAMGQMVYLTMLGLKSPCQSARIPFFSQVLTHFATEESVETGAGKLKEELNRLRPMMYASFSHAFVLINELFTTATTYDAYIMGKRVMKHFMEENCYGIYVTHIQELAEEEKGIVSLVAQVNHADSHIRTYKMSRMAPEGIGYASDIVEKYHLTYREIKNRLTERSV